MGTSISAGLEKIGSEIDRVIIMLCDQPLVTTQFLNSLGGNEAPIAAAEYNGIVGVPACFGRSFFNELMRLKKGAREIIRSHENMVVRLPCPEASFDVDTSEDLERMRLEEARNRK